MVVIKKKGMNMGYFYFEIGYYENDTYGDKQEKGIVCASSISDVWEKMNKWFPNIFDFHTWDVDMNTEEVLFESDFPGLMSLIKRNTEA